MENVIEKFHNEMQKFGQCIILYAINYTVLFRKCRFIQANLVFYF